MTKIKLSILQKLILLGTIVQTLFLIPSYFYGLGIDVYKLSFRNKVPEYIFFKYIDWDSLNERYFGVSLCIVLFFEILMICDIIVLKKNHSLRKTVLTLYIICTTINVIGHYFCYELTYAWSCF